MSMQIYSLNSNLTKLSVFKNFFKKYPSLAKFDSKGCKGRRHSKAFSKNYLPLILGSVATLN